MSDRSWTISPTDVAESAVTNFRLNLALWPKFPAAFSPTYSRILTRATGGNWFPVNMRPISFADSPLLLCGLLRMVQAVLRDIPSALACSSSV